MQRLGPKREHVVQHLRFYVKYILLSQTADHLVDFRGGNRLYQVHKILCTHLQISSTDFVEPSVRNPTQSEREN